MIFKLTLHYRNTETPLDDLSVIDKTQAQMQGDDEYQENPGGFGSHVAEIDKPPEKKTFKAIANSMRIRKTENEDEPEEEESSLLTSIF